MSEQPLLQVHNLKTYFYTEDGVMPSVDGVDFDLHEGDHGFGCYNSSADHAVTERFERKNRHINHHYHT